MFGDIGWAELLLVGVVALIVIGPEDLPDMFRQLGRFTAKLRAMGRDFSRAMEQAAKDSGVKDVAKDLQNVTSAKSMGLDKVKQAADRFEKWDPMKPAVKPAAGAKPAGPLTPPPMPATPVDSAPAVSAPPGPATQALYDKQASKRAILKESAEKLKALDAAPQGPSPVAAPAPAPLRAARTRSAVKAAEAVRRETPPPAAAEPTAAKPKAPRKKKADPA